MRKSGQVVDPNVERALWDPGLNIRPAKAGMPRLALLQSALTDYSDAIHTVDGSRQRAPCSSERRPAWERRKTSKSANCTSHLRRRRVPAGMIMFIEDSSFNTVVFIDQIEGDAAIYDVDVKGAHNFIADKTITRSSIYAFRGADIGACSRATQLTTPRQ